MARPNPSILEDFGVNANSCGYCGREDRSSISHGMWAHSLSVEAYQELLDRGWRRSGRWLYKPEMATCCPQYTIRLDHKLFEPTKAQRRIMRKMEKYLPGSDSHAGAAESGIRDRAARANGLQQEATGQAQNSTTTGGSTLRRRRQQQQQQQQTAPRTTAAKAPGDPRQVSDSDAGLLAQAIDQAVDSCRSEGLLPSASFPGSKALRPSPKQQKLLAEDVRLMSPSAKAIAGAARKADPERSDHFGADAVANMLAARLNERMLPAGWCVEAVDGYLNCHLPPSDADTLAQEVEAAEVGAVAAADSAATQQVSQQAPTVWVIRSSDSSQPAVSVQPSPAAICRSRDLDGAGPAANGLSSAPNGCSLTAGDSSGAAAKEGSPVVNVFASAATGVSPATDGATASAGWSLKVRIGKRRSFSSLDGASPDSSSMTMRSDRWQTVDGSSPMSISGMSPAMSQRLSRNNSMAAVTSADASVGSGPWLAAFPGSPPSSLASPPVWGIGFDGVDLGSAPGDNAGAAPQREFKRSRRHDHDGASQHQSEWGAHRSSGLPPRPPQLTPGASKPAAGGGSRAGIEMPADRSGEGVQAQRDLLTAQPPMLDIRMVPATAEVVDVEFDLYKSYQMQQHGDSPDEVTRRQFIRFLVDSPLLPRPTADSRQGGEQPQYGSFHMQYWLGQQLIAVSVVDVLPKCLSSVYMFWDKRFAHLSLGKYSVLRELQFVREAHHVCPQLRYVYLGFWIRNNDKMAYKADFQPSDLLCPYTLCWVPHARVQHIIDGASYTNLSAVPHALDGLGPDHGVLADGMPDPSRIRVDAEAVLNTMLLLGGGELGRQVVQLRQLLQTRLLSKVEAAGVRKRIEGIHAVVGREVGSTMILAAHLTSIVAG